MICTLDNDYIVYWCELNLFSMIDGPDVSSINYILIILTRRAKRDDIVDIRLIFFFSSSMHIKWYSSIMIVLMCVKERSDTNLIRHSNQNTIEWYSISISDKFNSCFRTSSCSSVYSWWWIWYGYRCSFWWSCFC